jgi:hypothetical protein
MLDLYRLYIYILLKCKTSVKSPSVTRQRRLRPAMSNRRFWTAGHNEVSETEQ